MNASWCCDYEPGLFVDAEFVGGAGFLRGAECPSGAGWYERGASIAGPRLEPTLALARSASVLPASVAMVALSIWALRVVGLQHEGIVFVASAAFSALFHVSDALDARVVGFAPTHWQRLDRICAVYAFCLVLLGVAGLHSRSVRRPRADALRTLALVGVLYAQEVDPSSMLSGALLPSLLLATGCAVDIASSAARRARVIVLCFRLDFQIGGGAVVLATLFFTLALDRSVDHLRVLHGAWHALIATGYWLLLRAVIGVDALRREEESGKGEGGYTWRARRDGGGGGGGNGSGNGDAGGASSEVPNSCCCGLRLLDILDSVGAAGEHERGRSGRCREAGEGAPLLGGSSSGSGDGGGDRGGSSRRGVPSRSSLAKPRTRVEVLRGRSRAPFTPPRGGGEALTDVDSPLGTDSFYANDGSPLLPSPLHVASETEEDDSFFRDSP